MPRSRRCWRNSTQAISATAPPPTPLNSATICGIAVIFTCARRGDADGGAERDAERDQAPVAHRRGCSSVATTAIAMPTAAMRLPRTAVRGPVSPRRPWMKSEKRDDVEDVDEVLVLQERGGERGHQRRRPRRPPRSRASGLLLNISSMRSVTRKPPTTLIVPKAIAITSRTLLSVPSPRQAEHEQAAEQHDPVDRVGARHQRRVQRVRAPSRSPRSRRSRRARGSRGWW